MIHPFCRSTVSSLMLTLLICQLSYAQHDQFNNSIKDYRILLTDETISSSANVETAWNALRIESNSMSVEGFVYAIVQHHDIPSKAEQENMRSAGLNLIAYVPHYAWIAKIDPALTTVDLLNMNVRSIHRIKANMKMPRDMERGEVPSRAGNSEALLAKLIFWYEDDVTNTIDLSEYITGQGGVIEKADAQNKTYWVNTDLESLPQWASDPLIQYLEWPEPNKEDEFFKEITLIQSNYISDNPTQHLFFNGAGVDFAVNESGAFDSTQSPNLKGRLNRNFESGNNDGHKTSVGMRMASAGNLNPDLRGDAFGATLHSGGINFGDAAANGISIVNNSFGYGCIGASTIETYNSGAEINDRLVRLYPSFMVTYSCGNQGQTDCGYGGGLAGGGWGNITGLTKSAKNIFAVGALTTAGNKAGFSSSGPAWDGRILPDICATGPGGTSHASPNLAGVFAQLIEAYRFSLRGSNT